MPRCAKSNNFGYAMRMRRERLLLLWIAFVTLFAQFGGALHVYSHVADFRLSRSGLSHPADNPHAPAKPQVCEQCLAFAQIGAALPSVPHLLVGETAHIRPPCTTFVSATMAPSRAYLSRAPPHLV